jgi:hypothetical protein
MATLLDVVECRSKFFELAENWVMLSFKLEVSSRRAARVFKRGKADTVVRPT